MNRSSLYQKFNIVQRRDAKEAIKQYKNMFQWRLDGQDRLLDVGCGTGDITIDFVLPIMPKKFKKVIGADISENMVRYARDKYYKNSKISFVQMDITADTNKLVKIIGGKVDHITSFYCLHWIQEQKKALDNIYNLLNPYGNCLLVFLAANRIFDIYQQLSKMPKWQPYMKDVDRFISPYHYSKNPTKDFAELVHSAGFSEFTIEIRNKIFTFEGISVLKNFLLAINPFIDRMPYDIRDQYFDDFIAEVSRLPLCENVTRKNDLLYNNIYKLMVVHARK